MKKTFLFTFCFSLFSYGATAQDLSLKYGKITNYELSMKTYDKDSTAEAVIMYDDGYVSYDYTNESFKVRLELKQKIKILKQEGVDRATISIPYYYKSNGNRDAITNLEAISYNLEDGKVIKTKLKKKYIFDEEINNRYRQVKFSIPNVKVGSVIEYKYTRVSDHAYDLPDWSIQSSIPVINSTYEAIIPEYFIFNNETKGYESIKVTESSQNQQFNLGMSEIPTQTLSAFSKK